MQRCAYLQAEKVHLPTANLVQYAVPSEVQMGAGLPWSSSAFRLKASLPRGPMSTSVAARGCTEGALGDAAARGCPLLAP